MTFEQNYRRKTTEEGNLYDGLVIITSIFQEDIHTIINTPS